MKLEYAPGTMLYSLEFAEYPAAVRDELVVFVTFQVLSLRSLSDKH